MFFFGQLRAGSSATRVDLPLQYLRPKHVSQSDFSFRVIVTGAHARVLFFSSLLFFLLCLFRWRIAYGPQTIASSKIYPSVYLCKDCFCRPEYSHFVRSVRKHESLRQEREGQEREEQEERALQLEKEKKDGPATLHRSQSLDRLLQQAQKVLRGGCLCLFYDCCPRALCHFYFIFFLSFSLFFFPHFFRRKEPTSKSCGDTATSSSSVAAVERRDVWTMGGVKVR